MIVGTVEAFDDVDVGGFRWWRDALSDWRFITGITGFLGRYLMIDALKRRENVVVLARNRRGTTAVDRVDQVISEFERQTSTTLIRPRVLTGDLGSEGLGLSKRESEWFCANVRSVIHSAASVCFLPTARGEPINSNVHGTRRLLELCRDSRVTDFHYVSTAYSCGRVDPSRPVFEELHPKQGPFGNIYEDSKCQGEHLVSQAVGAFSRTIFRPSIVIGEATSGYTSSFNTIYTPLRLAWLLFKESTQVPPTEAELLEELGLIGNETRNIVPVDWVCDMISALTRNPASHGKIYHLTNPRPTEGRAIIQAIRRAVSGDSQKPNAEKACAQKVDMGVADFNAHMDAYRSYFTSDPIFDNSRFREQSVTRPCPVVDADMLTRTFQHAVKVEFKSDGGPAVPFEQRAPRFQLEALINLDDITPHSGDHALRIVNENPPDQSISSETQPHAATLVRMTLTGTGGGTWQVRETSSGIQVEYPSAQNDCSVQFYGSASAFRGWLSSDSSIESGLRSGVFVLMGNAAQLSDATRMMGSLRDQILTVANDQLKPEEIKTGMAKQSQNALPVGTAAC